MRGAMETVVLGTASPRVVGIVDYSVAEVAGAFSEIGGDGNSVFAGFAR